MIAYIKGIIGELTPTEVVIEAFFFFDWVTI